MQKKIFLQYESDVISTEIVIIYLDVKGLSRACSVQFSATLIKNFC